ncbi:hypothetical protein Q4512_16230 [Oceanihabitans sp. 2_MG-2023]|jgi:hypothetical protein|uniref:hypothetical protein n=1 Tax=Oceanihabitans sp. 2_MG-2023 TaxID=3062661 RepID=UPI0026E370BC|nr:hypothetical protein [Oceanihabitans sp. 2_MG-2023]MDO6598468.1 hypothetical protein [Oceanihabitans sp. 2_MG-2023]
MEENVLMWIQNENSDKFDYMFYGTQLLEEKNLQKIKVIRELIFNNPNSKKIWKEKGYSQSSVLQIENNFVITGVLKTVDSNGRHLPFMFYFPKNKNNLEEIIYKNLKKIQKEIDSDLLQKLLSKTKIDNKKKIIIYSAILLTFIILLYKILK